MKRFRIFFALFLISMTFSSNIFTAGKGSTSWISAETLSSVVKLGTVLDYYYVEGLSEDYRYKEVDGKPYFGSGTLVRKTSDFVHVGSGVVVTDSGLVVSNAHVTMAYSSPSAEAVYLDGKNAYGPSGKLLSVVSVEKYPGWMFVGINDKSSIEKGDYRQYLKYAARVVQQDPDYEKKEMDRAILQITNYAEYDSEEIPVIGKKIGNEKFSFAKLANPFKYDYIEKDVLAVGYPGVGDPNRAAVTEGTRIGYAGDDSSVIKHTCFISGGNSGGALFYNDALIGINTWDDKRDASRPVSLAQPVTFWNRKFAEVHWLYPNLKLPVYSDEWLKQDPCENEDKAFAVAHFCLMKAHNSTKTVDEGFIVALKQELNGRDFWNYLDYSKEFSRLAKMVRFAWLKSDRELMKENKELTAEDLKVVRSIKNVKEIREYLSEEAKPYFDLWYSPEFILSINDIVFDGKANVIVPRGSKVKIFYMNAGREKVTELASLTTEQGPEQGPYYIYLDD